jgi:hypothetical protein
LFGYWLVSERGVRVLPQQGGNARSALPIRYLSAVVRPDEFKGVVHQTRVRDLAPQQRFLDLSAETLPKPTRF